MIGGEWIPDTGYSINVVEWNLIEHILPHEHFFSRGSVLQQDFFLKHHKNAFMDVFTQCMQLF